MILFLKFLTAHLIGDFVLQPKQWVKDKEKKKIKSVKLYLHIATHALLLLIFLQFNMNYAFGIVFIISSHALIDFLKVTFQTKKTKRLFFFLDQLAHLTCLGIAYTFYRPYPFDYAFLFTKDNMLLASCLIFISTVSSIMISVIISNWAPDKKEEQSLTNAGKYIGYLERFLIFIFISIGKWEGVGFLLAAKSIFRFGDLTASKDRKLTEYVLIGTLLSFGLAILTGLVYSHYGR